MNIAQKNHQCEQAIKLHILAINYVVYSHRVRAGNEKGFARSETILGLRLIHTGNFFKGEASDFLVASMDIL